MPTCAQPNNKNIFYRKPRPGIYLLHNLQVYLTGFHCFILDLNYLNVEYYFIFFGTSSQIFGALKHIVSVPHRTVFTLKACKFGDIPYIPYIIIARLLKYIPFHKRRILLKILIESLFSYCPLIWMFCGRKLDRKMIHIHEKALRFVYDGYTSSFEKLA